jgi:hypothetical protein
MVLLDLKAVEQTRIMMEVQYHPAEQRWYGMVNRPV